MAPRIAPPGGALRASFVMLFFALALTLIGQGLPATTPAAQAANPPAADAPCTTTVSSSSALTSAVRTASNGSVICLANGSYGSVTLDANRSGWVTVRSANPFGAAFSSITLSNAAYIRFEKLDISGRFGNVQDSSHHIQIAGSVVGSVWAEAPPKSSSGPGPHDWVIEYNDIPDCYSFCVALVSESPDRYWPVFDIIVRGNKMGPMAGGEDAIRIHNWQNLVIEHNEIFGVIEDGSHNDCLQSVWGGHGITFRGNYLHDNNCQTFFLKDGYTTDIEVSNNLSLRNRAGSAPVVGQIWPSANVVMRDNTFWDDSAFFLRNGTYSSMFPSGPATNYEVTNNVFVQFLPYDDFQSDANRAGIFKNSSVLVEDRNVFGSGWSWVPHSMGAHSVQDSSPDFRRETTSRAQDLSVGDYRLAAPITKAGSTYTPGITWKLAGRTFGVEAYGLTPPDLGPGYTGGYLDAAEDAAPFASDPGLVLSYDQLNGDLTPLGLVAVPGGSPTFRVVGETTTTDTGFDLAVGLHVNGQDLALLYDRHTGALELRSVGGDGTTSSVLDLSVTRNWSHIVEGDFNADGSSDVLFYRDTDGLMRFYEVSVARGLVPITPAMYGTWRWDQLVVGDFDADGADDVMWYRATDGLMRFYEVGADHVFAAMTPAMYGTSHWSLVPSGDYDGDGADDLLYYRARDGLYRFYDVGGDGVFSAKGPAGYLASGWNEIRPVNLADWSGLELVLYQTGEIAAGRFSGGGLVTVGEPTGAPSYQLLATF